MAKIERITVASIVVMFPRIRTGRAEATPGRLLCTRRAVAAVARTVVREKGQPAAGAPLGQ
eukprot:8705707-Pyramimonas_sp.AAC.1